MSLARLQEAVRLLPAGHPAGQWLRAGVAFYETGRRFGVTLDAALEMDAAPAVTPRKAACYRRDALCRSIAAEYFAGLINTDQARQISIEIERYCRAEWPVDRDRGEPRPSPVTAAAQAFLSACTRASCT